MTTRQRLYLSLYVIASGFVCGAVIGLLVIAIHV